MRRLILIADADSAMSRLYRDALQVAGFDADAAADGRDALATVFARHPSAVVLAPDLAFIDGYELCRMLRGDGRTADIRTVFVTDTGADPEFARAWDAGADAVVHRADALLSLDEAVRGALASVRPPRASRAHATGRPRTRQGMLVRTHERFRTTQPPLAPPVLHCPSCDAFLAYDHSHVGGVSARFEEQWDYFVCKECGAFEFRQRTRILRPTEIGS